MEEKKKGLKKKETAGRTRELEEVTHSSFLGKCSKHTSEASDYSLIVINNLHCYC